MVTPNNGKTKPVIIREGLEGLRRTEVRVTVLMGGISTEREVSIRSGQAVVKGLKEAGYSVIPVVVDDTRLEGLDKLDTDVVFIAMHGYFGEDGGIQDLLESKGLPYTGSDVTASRTAIDKVKSKRIFRAHGLCTPNFTVITQDKFDKKGLDKGFKLESLPLVVKPSRNGSSIGVTIVRDEAGLVPALEVAFQYDDMVILEDFIEGREFTVGVLGEEALPIIEIKPSREFFDYEAKYKDINTSYILDPNISEGVWKQMQGLAIKAHKALGCRDFSRVDMMCDERGVPYLLEVNTIPGLTERSLLPKAALAGGISFSQLCSKIVDLALSRSEVFSGRFVKG